MMMPSTMILTICISMVLKRNRGLSLDIGSRLAGSKPTPPDKNFQSPVWGSSSTSGGLNPSNPPTNRTLQQNISTNCDLTPLFPHFNECTWTFD